MSTSAAGGTRTARHYISRFRCPTCLRRFAKPKLFVKHVKACRIAKEGTR